MKIKKLLLSFGICLLFSIIVSLIGVFLVYGTLLNTPIIKVIIKLFVVFCFINIVNILIESTKGFLRNLLSTLFPMILGSAVFTIAIYALAVSKFSFKEINWIMVFQDFYTNQLYYFLFILIFVGLLFLYFGFINKDAYKNLFSKSQYSDKKLKQVESNLENSRWMTNEERDKIFNSLTYSELNTSKKDGIPIRATYNEKKKDIDVTFINPCHTLIIGSTGSGKTTTFINPMIQLLGASKAGSSMIMTDPKGELFSLHSKFLVERGYDVKVLDLRDAYHSYRWNPLEMIWNMYQEYAEAKNNVFSRNIDVKTSGLELTENPSKYGDTWYEFQGKAFVTLDEAATEMKIFRTSKYDEMYEDLNDLVSVLIPVQNENDPMWEKGARSITMAVILGMLEDSENSELGMTKEKFNLFNMSKILQNSDNDYLALRRYFKGRDKLAKSVALSHQVCDCAEKTRSSYMSVLLEKLSLFNDTGICSLTSDSDFLISDLATKPTALFVKIPDEKDTRHGLASIFLTNVYKTLIKIASSYPDLSLPRNVYYILDEFGNMPKMEKFDKMITVGRSRKIWFSMVVQSYIQLNNVYGDTVADIVKGNCGVKMFIGSNDMGTCKEFSELCGNITIITESTSRGKDSESVSKSTQVRPLIYPSELQKLNNKFTSGNSIVVTFGNNPLKTNFTPSYKVPLYTTGVMNTDAIKGRLFEEKKIFYSIVNRNNIILGGKQENATANENSEKEKDSTKE